MNDDDGGTKNHTKFLNDDHHVLSNQQFLKIRHSEEPEIETHSLFGLLSSLPPVGHFETCTM